MNKRKVDRYNLWLILTLAQTILVGFGILIIVIYGLSTKWFIVTPNEVILIGCSLFLFGIICMIYTGLIIGLETITSQYLNRFKIF